LKRLDSRLLESPEFEMGPFLETVKRIKRQPITMATHKLGKNLRLKMRNEIPLQASKARLRHHRLLLPALVLVKSDEKVNFRIPACV
jgi:hypothetical protein